MKKGKMVAKLLPTEARLRDGRPKFRNAAGKSFQSKTTKSKSFQNNQEMDHIISPPA